MNILDVGHPPGRLPPESRLPRIAVVKGASRTVLRAGSVLLDSLIGLFILGMGAVAYFGLLPVVHRSSEISRQESRAAQIAARVIEQLGMLKPAEVNSSTLKQLNLIDGSSTEEQPWTFSNIPLDDGTSYSPAKVLRNGRGSIWMSSIANGSVLVTLEITWDSPSGASRSYRTGTIIGGYR